MLSGISPVLTPIAPASPMEVAYPECTEVLLGAYAVLCVGSAAQVGRIIYFHHNLFSFQFAFLAIQFAFSALRCVFYCALVLNSSWVLVNDETKCFARETVYGLPIFLQFAQFTLLVVFYCNRVNHYRWERIRTRVIIAYSTTNAVYMFLFSVWLTFIVI